MQPIGTLGNTRIIREEYVKELTGYRFLADGTGIVSFARYGSDIYLSYCECKVKNLKKNLQVTLQFLITIIFLKSWVFCYFNPTLTLPLAGSSHLEEPDHGLLDICPIYLGKLQCAIHVNMVERFGE
eukprot:bmy_10331T0